MNLTRRRKGELLSTSRQTGVWLKQLCVFSVILAVSADCRHSQAQILPVTAEVYRHVPLRLFGTNLYDFAPVIQDALSDGKGGLRFYVTGIVSQVGFQSLPGVIAVMRPVGTPRYAFRGSPMAEYGSTSDLLATASAAQLAQKGGGSISLGHYMSMSPNMRMNYERVQPVEELLVANVPSALRRKGARIAVFALPVAHYHAATGTFGTRGLPYFDYGEKFSGSITNFNALFRVTPGGIVCARLGNGAKMEPNPRASVDERLIRWQFEQATNGAPRAQYDLAQRYLRGDGVETNRTLGLHWLRKSAEQGHEPAMRQCESIGRSPDS